jgi:serine/threonine protein phosphatase PrpC
MNFIVSATTDIGISKSINQDSYNVRVFSTKQGKMVLAVLCDGMGGLTSGEVASASVVKAFCTWADTKLPDLCESGITDSHIHRDWTEILVQNNEKIKGYAAVRGINMGTTVTAMLLTEKKYYIMNIGDTRAYEIKDNVKLLTKDHTVVAREVELGKLTPQEAKSDSRRNVLLQCVGASVEVFPDMFVGETKLDAVYMLCSDGFRHEITENEMYEHLNPGIMVDADGMKDNMYNLIELNKQRREKDNISVISIRTF